MILIMKEYIMERMCEGVMTDLDDSYLFNIDAEKLIKEYGLDTYEHFVDHVSKRAYFKAPSLTGSLNSIFGNVKNVYIVVPFGDLRFVNINAILRYTHNPYNNTHSIIHPILLEFDNDNMIILDIKYPMVIKPLVLDKE